MRLYAMRLHRVLRRLVPILESVVGPLGLVGLTTLVLGVVPPGVAETYPPHVLASLTLLVIALELVGLRGSKGSAAADSRASGRDPERDAD